MKEPHVPLEVAPELLTAGLCSAALVVRGADNSRTSAELLSYRRQVGKRLSAHWKNRSISAHPAIREYHRLHNQVGVSNEPPAPEKLISYVRRQRDLTAAGPVVDCYNLVSAKTLLSIGAHDLAKLDTPVTLRIASATDVFVPLGETKEHSHPGEYAYVDPQNRIICRLDVLQCEYSKVTEQSSDIVFFLQGNRVLPATTLLKGAWLLAELIEKFCGGRAELVAFYDAGRAEVDRLAGPMVTHDEFKRLDLRVGTVLEARPHPGLGALSVVVVKLQDVAEALVPSCMVPDNVPGRRVVVATGLYPITLAGKQITSYLVTAHQHSISDVLQIKAAIPDGARLC